MDVAEEDEHQLAAEVVAVDRAARPLQHEIGACGFAALRRWRAGGQQNAGKEKHGQPCSQAMHELGESDGVFRERIAILARRTVPPP